MGGTPIGRAFPANTATEEPHQVVFRTTRSWTTPRIAVKMCIRDSSTALNNKGQI
ncbi:hypothetical protein DEO72_LG3g1590 [Vigna unguiculata]|uniref:Uncharacterized protein n=1 Tax=Vigna unguiculata TaxID=3917 RepID=A0A4D6LEL9_VIGUN|nr:hypothetical protein DEO72_LG3g1590 [Vigna unguiculata]